MERKIDMLVVGVGCVYMWQFFFSKEDRRKEKDVCVERDTDKEKQNR